MCVTRGVTRLFLLSDANMELLIKLIEKQQKSIDDISTKLDVLSTKLNNAYERIESLEKNDKHELIPFRNTRF